MSELSERIEGGILSNSNMEELRTGMGPNEVFIVAPPREEASNMSNEQTIENYPQGDSPETQIVTIKTDKKDITITPSSEYYKQYTVTCDDKSYRLNLEALVRVPKEVVVCLAEHAVRLKKHIQFHPTKGSIYNNPSLINKDTIAIIRCDTEHYAGKTTRIRNIEFPSGKIKLDEIEDKLQRRIRIYAQPEESNYIGYEFKDLRGNPIAYMSNFYGAILLLWNILLHQTSPVDMLVTYLDYVLTNYSAKCDEIQIKAIKKLEQEQEKKEKAEYNRFIERMYTDSIHALRHKIDLNNHDVDAHLRGLQTKGKEIHRDNDFLLKLKDRSASKEIKTQLESDYVLIKKLKETGKYTDFRFEAGLIIGRTSMITLFKKYNIGIFDVSLSLEGIVKCHNITFRCDGSYDHPHVSGGNPCWGNLGDAVFKMLRSNQFGAAFDVMFEFLMRYTDGKRPNANHGPYRLLEVFNPVFVTQGITLCNNCHRIKELCHCNSNDESEYRCPLCAESFENCQCPRCPATHPPYNLRRHNEECNCDECENWDADTGQCAY